MYVDGCCNDEKVSEAGGARAPEQAGQWAARAELAGRAVQARHLRSLWGMPGTLLGVSGRPASPLQRVHGPWNYWWQAHVLDCLVDAYLRSPDPRRQARVAKFVKRYADVATVLSEAATAFAADVTGGAFPDQAHSYK